MNKLKTLVSIAAALVVLLLAAMPVAFADEEGTTTGSFTADNAAPTITSVEVIPAGGGAAVASMTPGTSYKAKIVANDNNTVEDIDQVRVAIVFDSSDADPGTDPGEAGNTQTLACLKWVKSPEAWSISPTGGDTTWSTTAISCTKPSDMDLTTGTWEFYFTVGNVATEGLGGADNDGWDLFGEVVDEDGDVEMWDDRDLAMDWRGEIKDVTASVSFGTVVLGSSNTVCTSGVSATYIANGAYDEQVKAQTPWTGQTSGTTLTLDTAPPPSAAEFSLKADDDATIADAVQVLSAAYTAIDETDTITGETGDTQANNYLWLSLGSSGIPAEEYQGIIYYKIVDGT